jgi:CubicO group peptidase (beta-lactamase class C family)
MNRFNNFDQYIQDSLASWHCPGVAVVVVKEEDILHQTVYGQRAIADNLPLTADTRFAMASVTKSFTAMSVALLIDEGKLDWDKPVREYMPEFILEDAYATRHITIRDMLCHRSGMPRHDLAAWRLDISRTEFIKRMKHFKFSATFREKFQYNNLMYYAAAYLVEKVAGQKWEEFVHERIFAPLGMVASNFQPEPPQPEQFNAVGYRVDRDDEGAVKGLLPMPFGLHTELSPGAAGALFSTLADLTQWLKLHVNNGRAGDEQFVSPHNLKQMHLPQMVIPGGGPNEALLGNSIMTYGLGWMIQPHRGYTLIHHGGNVEGHSLIIGFVPQEKVGVVVLTNIAGLPLRDVLLYEGVDRALNLSDRDWNGRFHAMFDPLLVGQAKAKQTAVAEKMADAPPTHPLDAYVGAYEAEGYPDFAVRRTADGFAACTVGSLDWSALRHYHYNLFEWHWADFDAWVKVQFQVNENGDIDAVAVPIEPAVDNIIFKRKQPQLTPEMVAALLGDYETPIEGLAFTISANEEKLYLTQTGGAPEEIKAYKLTDEVIGLSLRRTRFDFTRESDGTIVHLTIKALGMTLTAVRRGS